MVRTFAPRLARIAFLPLILLIRPPNAAAALGGNVSTVDSDRVHVQGALMRIVQNGPVAMHELRSSSGTMIREYVNSSSGTVFAVAWDGPWLPDLRQVLGEHFDHYQAAMRGRQQARSARGAVAIDDAGLVVQMSGHPRAFVGRAYLTGSLPAGIQLETIR
jgi:Protein of unknown function (DUF2844)